MLSSLPLEIRQHFCRNLTFSKILEFLWNPPLQLYFCFLNLLLFFRGSFGFGFGHLYGFLGLEREYTVNTSINVISTILSAN